MIKQVFGKQKKLVVTVSNKMHFFKANIKNPFIRLSIGPFPELHLRSVSWQGEIGLP